MLKELFDDVPNGMYILVKAVNKEEQVETLYTKDIRRINDFARKKSKEGWNVFYSPALRNVKEDTKKAITLVNILWVDLDKEFEPDWFLLPPSYIVNSGHNKHLYWLLDKYIQVDEAEVYLKKLCNYYGGDKSCAQVNSLLRIPGTINYKNEESKVVLEQVNNGHKYSISEINTALSNNWSQWIYKVKQVVEEGARSEYEFSLFKDLSSVGFKEELITHLALYHAAPTSKIHDENNPNYLDRTVTKVVTGSGNPLNIYEGDDIYFTYNEKGQPVTLSNFIFKIKAIQKDTGNKSNFFIVDIIAGKNIWHNVPIASKIFVNANTFNTFIPFVQMTWFGNDYQTKRLKMHLSSKHEEEGLPLVNTTDQLGIQLNPDIYVTNEVVYNRDFIPVDDTLYIPPVSNLYPIIKSYAPTKNIKFFEDVVQLNSKNEMLSILGWFTATHIKPILKDIRGIRFPHLVVTGSRGAGKTTLITKVFQPYVGYVNSQVWQSSSSPFVLLSLLGCSTSIPVCLTEYRHNTQRYAANFERVLRTHYDDGKESKGRVDLTTTTYPLTAPVCIDGEEPITDPALLERIIGVHLDVRNVAKSKGLLDHVIKYDIRGIGSGVLNYILQQSNESIYDIYTAQLEKLQSLTIADRIKDNHAMVNTGLELLYTYLDYDLGQYVGVNQDTVNEAIKLPAYIFLEAIINNTLSEQADPSIMFKNYEDKHIYAFNLTSAYNWFIGQQRRLGQDSTPPKNTIRNQLLEMDNIFIEMKNGGTNQGKVMSMYYINLKEASKVLDIEVVDD